MQESARGFSADSWDLCLYVSRQSVIETAAGVQRLAIEPGPKISNNTICAAYVHCHFCHMSHVYKWCVLFEVPAGICPQSHRLIPRK